MSIRHALVALIVAAALGSAGCRRDESESKKPETKPSTPATAPATMPATTKAVAAPKPEEETIISLFDGKTLNNWKPSEFGGDGEVKVENGQIIVGAGASLSGVTWKGRELPKMDYEIELDAMKVSGEDFFLGLTFPYGKEGFASLVLGGWGGSTTGISSIDGFDAANNETMGSKDFKPKKWYHVRVKCTKEKIEAWVDDEQIVDCKTENRKIDVRIDIDNAKPFGMATYQTVGAYKNIVIRKLP